MATKGSVRAQKDRQNFKKAALTELKGEKGRVCCLFWMIIVNCRSRSIYETSQITIWVDLTSVAFDYWVTNVELG